MKTGLLICCLGTALGIFGLHMSVERYADAGSTILILEAFRAGPDENLAEFVRPHLRDGAHKAEIVELLRNREEHRQRLYETWTSGLRHARSLNFNLAFMWGGVLLAFLLLPVVLHRQQMKITQQVARGDAGTSGNH